MKKLVTGLAVLTLSCAVTAQESVPDTASEAVEATAVLIADPLQEEPEYYEAQGAAEAEIVSEEELLLEAQLSDTFHDDMSGDMAAMPEIAEDSDW